MKIRKSRNEGKIKRMSEGRKKKYNYFIPYAKKTFVFLTGFFFIEETWIICPKIRVSRLREWLRY